MPSLKEFNDLYSRFEYSQEQVDADLLEKSQSSSIKTKLGSKPLPRASPQHKVQQPNIQQQQQAPVLPDYKVAVVDSGGNIAFLSLNQLK